MRDVAELLGPLVDGVILRGGHHLKSWSATQKKVTLSSAEAELAACIKTSSEVIGILQMAAGLGRTVAGEVYVDSSAALAVVGRKGNGKLRHIRVGQPLGPAGGRWRGPGLQEGPR